MEENFGREEFFTLANILTCSDGNIDCQGYSIRTSYDKTPTVTATGGMIIVAGNYGSSYDHEIAICKGTTCKTYIGGQKSTVTSFGGTVVVAGIIGSTANILACSDGNIDCQNYTIRTNYDQVPTISTEGKNIITLVGTEKVMKCQGTTCATY